LPASAKARRDRFEKPHVAAKLRSDGRDFGLMRLSLFDSASGPHDGSRWDRGRGYKQFVHYNVVAVAFGQRIDS